MSQELNELQSLQWRIFVEMVALQGWGPRATKLKNDCDLHTLNWLKQWKYACAYNMAKMKQMVF